MQQNKDSSKAKASAWNSGDVLTQFSDMNIDHTNGSNSSNSENKTQNEEPNRRKNRRTLMSPRRIVSRPRLMIIDDSAPSTSSHKSYEVISPPLTNSGEELTLKNNQATVEENAPKEKLTHPMTPTKKNGKKPKRTNRDYSQITLSKPLPEYRATMKRKFIQKDISKNERQSREKNNLAARESRHKQKLSLQSKIESFVHLVLVRRSLQSRLKAMIDNFWFKST